MKDKKRFIVKVTMTGSAFENADELVRVLRDLANSVSMYAADMFTLRDINGNTCGTAEYKK